MADLANQGGGSVNLSGLLQQLGYGNARPMSPYGGTQTPQQAMDAMYAGQGGIGAVQQAANAQRGSLFGSGLSNALQAQGVADQNRPATRIGLPSRGQGK